MKSRSFESVAAQTEGDTGYDYNDIYDEDYEEESGMNTRLNTCLYRLRAKALFKGFGERLFRKQHQAIGQNE